MIQESDGFHALQIPGHKALLWLLLSEENEGQPMEVVFQFLIRVNLFINILKTTFLLMYKGIQMQ